MKPFNFSCNIKQNLVKITIIVALSFSSSFLSFSNPVLPGPMIFEIYFGPEGWQIEMKNTMYFEKNSLSSGMYFYTLELNNHKVASGKMIISQ